MKPKIFVASSREQKDLAYAAQEGLEHELEVTVWSQGVFNLSKTAMADLIDVLEDCDFGLFVLAPDDVASIRDQKKQIVRDNVIFELGLFIGRLGIERCFMIVPRGIDDLQLPSDLAGIIPADYDAQRRDNNLTAALGTACTRIRRAVQKLGVLSRPTTRVNMQTGSEQAVPDINVDPLAGSLISDDRDCFILLSKYLGSYPVYEPLRYSAVDHELGLVPGSTKKHLPQACSAWNLGLSMGDQYAALVQ